MNRNKESSRQLHKLWLEIIKLGNVVLITLPFGICWYLYYVDRLALNYYRKGISVVIFIFAILYLALGRTYSAFQISLHRRAEVVYSQALAEIFSDFIMYLIIFLLAKKFLSIWPLLLVLVIQIVLSFIWITAAQKVYFKRTPPLPTVIVWDMRESFARLVDEYGLRKRFDIIGNVYVKECVEDIEGHLGEARAVFLCGIHSHERNQIIKYCVEKGIRAYVIPRVGDMIMSSATSMHLFHLPILALERYNPSPFYLFIKRLFDIVISGVAIVILSPVMLVVSILIKRDGGTVFFRQRRLTKDGKVFDVLKFRSMRMDAEKDGVARLSTGDKDDRITPVGRVIRSCRIDELPQLINILKGDMSIVGPRPERPEIAEEYQEKMPEFCLRLQMKAGLTGMAQVYGKYNTTPYDKLLMDLQYIAKAGVVEDLKIIFATVKILFLPESTEGIQEGQTTAMSDGGADGAETQREEESD